MLKKPEPPRSPVSEDTGELLYRLHGKPPLWETLAVAVQHVLAVFGGVVAPPLVIANALHFDTQMTACMAAWHGVFRDWPR